MSSPLGFDAGGMGAIGTDELRLLEPGDGEGLRLRGKCGDVGELGEVGGGDVGRAKRNANGLKGSFDRSGG